MTASEKLPAALYARISRDATGEGLGVERQLQDCQELAQRLGWNIVHEYVDNDISAYSGKKRPEYERLCDDIKQGVVKGLVIWHPDRLHRSTKELEEFISLIEAKGTEIQTVTAGVYDLTTPTGRMQARMVGAVARHESEHKSERIRRKKLELAESGAWNGGGRPFGYSKGGIIIEEEAQLIRSAAQQVLNGISMRAITRSWNEAGSKTPRGNAWLPQVIRRNLLSPTHAGYRVHRGKIMGKGNWEPILDEQTWERVCAILTNPARQTNHGIVVRKRLLAGMLICGKCGTPLMSAVVNKKPSYSCKKDQTRTGCGALTVTGYHVENLLRDFAIKRICESPAIAQGIEDSQPYLEAFSEVEVIRNRIKKLQEAHFVEETVDKASFKEMSKTLEGKLEEAQTRLASVSRSALLTGIPQDSEALLARWEDESLEWKRALLSSVIESATILPAQHKGERFNPDRVKVTPRKGLK